MAAKCASIAALHGNVRTEATSSHSHQLQSRPLQLEDKDETDKAP